MIVIQNIETNFQTLVLKTILFVIYDVKCLCYVAAKISSEWKDAQLLINELIVVFLINKYSQGQC